MCLTLYKKAMLTISSRLSVFFSYHASVRLYTSSVISFLNISFKSGNKTSSESDLSKT